MVIYFPFTSDKDKFGTTVAFIFISGILVLFIWVFQWIWGLIPVILNRAYINYSIQLIFNLLLISGIILFIVNDNKKVKKVNQNGKSSYILSTRGIPIRPFGALRSGL